MATARQPTPPVAPVTSTSPDSGVTPDSWSRSTDKAAVNPAVPYTMLSLRLNPSGRFTAHAAGTRTYSA